MKTMGPKKRTSFFDRLWTMQAQGALLAMMHQILFDRALDTERLKGASSWR
jgi:hypothetical protein